MKVGTDGVLLGAWAKTGGRMLDIGTGTGLIALMLAQRSPDGIVDAVDIDDAAVSQARENISASPFADRINVMCCDIKTFRVDETSCYDAIVSNPPYFQSSLGCPDDQRHLARHTDSLSFRELFAVAERLLAPDGTFSIIIPFDCRKDILSEAALHGFLVCRECGVRTTPRKQPRRYLLTFYRGEGLEVSGEGLEVGDERSEEHILTDSDGNRSEWYANLTKDFYL